MSFEVEQKFPLTDARDAMARLDELGAEWGEPVEQVDTYFNHPGRDFAETDEALRVRCVGEANCVTYKGPKLDAETKTRREIELPLGEGSRTAGQMIEMLEALGFAAVGEVKKTRRPSHIAWQGREVVGALDEVVGLGQFLELELTVDTEGVEEAKRVIQSLAERLDLKQSERKSYLELLLNQP